MKRGYTSKQSERPVKMARIDQIEQSKDIMRSNKEVANFEKDNTKILIKNYILNDVNALEKKWNMRNVEAIQVSEEAIDGSNVSVVMKTALFEVVKNNFLSAIQNDNEVEKVEMKRTVKAKASNGSSAEVEFMVDITLNKEGVKHEVVLTCYNTANRLYLQKRGAHEYLGPTILAGFVHQTQGRER